VAGPVVFDLTWLVLGMLRPGFSIISQPVSGLGIAAGPCCRPGGPDSALMNAAFVAQGLLIVVGVFAAFQTIRELSPAARRTCVLLLGIGGVGSAMDGVFTLASAPLGHLTGFLLLFFVVPLCGFTTCGLLLRRSVSWRRFGTLLAAVGCPVTLALSILFFLTFNPSTVGTDQGVAGLTERIAGFELQGWYAALGWLAFRKLS
jgi:hypothetical membrane protein